MPSPLPGLLDAHYDHLKTSAIDDAIIAERGYVSIDGLSAWQALGAPALSRGAKTTGIAFPVYRLGKTPPHSWALRPDHPRSPKGKTVKYECAPTVPNCFDVLPRYQAALADPSIPLWITEGVKKADALASAYGAAIVPVNENGVWGFRATNPLGGKAIIPDFDEIAWNGRRVVLAFDSDVVRKPQVMAALRRLGAVLHVRGAAEILALLLPQQGAAKLGVDDYLAAGHTTADLEAFLFPLSQVAAQAQQTLGAHPITGREVVLPIGYSLHPQTGAISALDERGKATPLYPDLLTVTSLGRDLVSRVETMTVTFGANGHRASITAPKADLANATAIIGHLASAGAAIHSRNAAPVCEYLSLFAHTNGDALPRHAQAARLGVIGDGLVTPAGGVGFAEPVAYIGRYHIRIGADATAYPAALRAILPWGCAPNLWLALGLSLASPAIRRLRPRRNPAVYNAGGPSTGKTTINQFAIGAWGNPTAAPFRLDAIRLTRPGLFQTFEHLHGLPLLVDEAHLADDLKHLESWVYQFANGEDYVRGGRDGHAIGGDETGGALLLAGEARPEFRHGGAANRLLLVDGARWAPLGEGTIGDLGSAEHALGAARASQLEAAWVAGAGLFGRAVAEVIWRDWDSFVRDVRTMAGDPGLAARGDWREALACGVVALNVAFQVAEVAGRDLPDPGAWVGALIDSWALMLKDGRSTGDPATDAWESLMALLAQCTEYNQPSGLPGWITLEDRGQLIACRDLHGDAWRVLTGTPQFQERVGKSAAQLHGAAWIRRGWVRAGRDGATEVRALPGRKQARTLLIPIAMLEGWSP
jgi:hypothetical protein